MICRAPHALPSKSKKRSKHAGAKELPVDWNPEVDNG